MKNTDAWTRLHDLAIVFLALAYGTDKDLADEELDTIVDALRVWRPDLDVKSIQEIVIETMAVFLEGSVNEEVIDSVNTLNKTLTKDERIRAINDAIEIAKADGVVLDSEHSLITALASAWQIKTEVRVDEVLSGVSNNRPEGWNLLHDVGLLFIIVGHAGDNKLEDSEIAIMLARLSPWAPDMDEEGLRKCLRSALSFYASDPGLTSLRESVASLKESLPTPQRLALLDDLIHVAAADGDVNTNEKELIASIGMRLDVSVNLAPA